MCSAKGIVFEVRHFALKNSAHDVMMMGRE
jgi:hypothetical protein